MRLILEISIDTIRQFYASFMVPAVFLSPLQDENINGTTKTRSTAKQAHKSKRFFFSFNRRVPRRPKLVLQSEKETKTQRNDSGDCKRSAHLFPVASTDTHTLHLRHRGSKHYRSHCAQSALTTIHHSSFFSVRRVRPRGRRVRRRSVPSDHPPG